MATDNFAIQLFEITKVFGDVVANNKINLDVKKGEILALLGENGSGKTTLMNMLSGVYRPNKGQIFVNGKKVYIDTPEDSKKLGIGMVHQHFKLVEKFSAIDNIWMGADTPTFGFVEKYKEIKNKNFSNSKCKNNLQKIFKYANLFFQKISFDTKNYFLRKDRKKIVEQFISKYDFNINLDKPISSMSVGEKQTVEIIKVLYYGANILILDEPTAVLTLQEIQKLFVVLKKMRDEGCAVVIITHKLNEVMQISDRVSLLRKGEYVGTVETKLTNENQLTEMMVGKKIDLKIERPKSNFCENLMTISNLNVINEDKINVLKNISLELKKGEILGIAGISGNGQKELCEAIAGLQNIQNGKIIYNQKNIAGKSPLEIINMGISMSFIPEDRIGMGLAGTMNIIDNVLLKSYRKNKKVLPKQWLNPFIDKQTAKSIAKNIVANLGVVTPDIDATPIKNLSGGNVQKILLGREIIANPQVIITAYPVRGLDINSSYLIYDILNQQKLKGVGILFVGEDLDVMLQLCDRIAVICHGEMSKAIDASEVTKEQLGLMMTGVDLKNAIKKVEVLDEPNS